MPIKYVAVKRRKAVPERGEGSRRPTENDKQVVQYHPPVQGGNHPVEGEAPRIEGNPPIVGDRNPNPESSNPPPEAREAPTERWFTMHQWHLLLRRFTASQINWLTFNNETKVGVFVDKVLEEEEARTPTPSPPRKVIPDDVLAELLEKEDPVEISSDEETVSVRLCIVCDGFGHKDDTVKCRKCGYWYHTWCADEPDREGREDPHFSFWLCPKCKPDPKVDPGYKFTYRSKEDIEKDKHYEDSDYDNEPDYRLFN